MTHQHRGVTGSLLFTVTLMVGCSGGSGGTTADTTPPSVPVIASAVPVSTSEIDVAWNASTDAVGVAGYRVSRDGAQVAAPTTLSYRDSRLGAGTEHCYTVAAFDGAGNVSAPSAPACATTLTPPPPAPVALEALGSDGAITLRWAPVDGATSYNVYFAEVAGVTQQNWASLRGGGRIVGAANPYVHAGLVNLTAYFYVVTGANAGGESPDSLEVAAQPVRAPAEPLVGGWDWLQPRATGDGLEAVRFLGAEGWAVGSPGTILHTVDGGATWERQASGTTSPLHDVHFADAATGWAVGQGGAFGLTYGTLFHTTDGGASWWSQATGGVPILYGVAFLDATTGWAVGDRGTILHTTDAGQTWGSVASGTEVPLWKVRFLDATRGWIAGGNGAQGVVLRTTDGGATWSSATVLNTQIVDLAFANTLKGWAVDAATAGRILGTNDGGATWGPLPTGSGATLLGIAFADASTGWAVGTSGRLLKTTNGGGSWSSTYVGLSANLSGIAVTGQDLVVVGTPEAILRSADGGATWTLDGARTLPRVTPATLAFADASTGFAAAGATVYGTVDGGFTWAALPAFSSEPLGWLELVSASAGFAVGGSDGTCLSPPCNAVYRTLDGGASWHPRGHVADAGMQLWDVDFADDQHGWAVGPGGLVRATADAGATWTTQPTATTSLLMAVKAVSASTAWAVGSGGLILKTEDGGATWIGQPSATTQDLWAVAAVDASRAWAVGGSSIVATTDGGSTWVARQHGDGYLSDVWFVSASTGWAVGYGGLVLGTIDGGATWQQQACATTQDLRRVRAANGSVGWVVTVSGDLLGTVSGGR